MIEVGEYVRTKNGKITKLIKLGKHCVTVGHGMQEFQEYCRFKNSHYINANNYEELSKKINKYITKHSKNIIDLIEVGDIVHTRDVLNEDIVYIWSEEFLKACKEDLNNGIELVDILTHEKYMQNCYTVEREEE